MSMRPPNGAGAGEQEAGERDRRLYGDFAGGVEEQREVSVVGWGSDERDVGSLPDDLRANRDLCERGSVSHARVGRAAFGP